MSKLINQISIGCAVNSAVISDVMSKENGSFKDSCIEVPKKYNIVPPVPDVPWPFQNASWEAYKPYCMIVVPKEQYKLPEEDQFNSLRNAISHVNYSIEEGGSFVIWDHPHKKEAEEFWHWHIEITKANMHLFLGEVNEYIFKLYNEINQGLRYSNTYLITYNSQPN